jgi:hypothetical protein
MVVVVAIVEEAVAVEAPQRMKGKPILSEFHKNKNSETIKRFPYIGTPGNLRFYYIQSGATSTHHHKDQEYDFPEADPVFCPPPRTMDRIPAGEPKQRRRKRGRRSDLLVRLRRRAHRAPLPSILLANVQSLTTSLMKSEQG